MKIGIVAALLIALFRFSLWRLWLKTNPISGEPNWGHAVVVPLIGLYYLYVNREQLLSQPVQPLLGGNFSRNRFIAAGATVLAGLCSYFMAPAILPTFGAYFESLGMGLMLWGVLAAALDWGLASLLFGIAVFFFGIYPGQNDYLKDLGMVVTIFGVVLMLCGWAVMRIAWFPIAFLICALPWPGLVYSMVASPLQQLAAKVAVKTLQFTGVTALSSGTKIFINAADGTVRTLNVAEACAGMRSLMTFISVGAAIAFLSGRPLWQKIFLTATAVPIAIVCNVMRVAGQGLLDHYWSREISEGFAHQFVGMVMLVPAFFLILLMGWILDQIFVEEVDDKTDLTAARVRSVNAATANTAVVSNSAPAPVAVPPRRPLTGQSVVPPPRPSLARRPRGSALPPRPPVPRKGDA